MVEMSRFFSMDKLKGAVVRHLFFFKKSSGARQETTTKKKTFVKLFQREKDDPLLFGKTIAARRSRMLIGRLLVQHITSLSFPIRL